MVYKISFHATSYFAASRKHVTHHRGAPWDMKTYNANPVRTVMRSPRFQARSPGPHSCRLWRQARRASPRQARPSASLPRRRGTRDTTPELTWVGPRPRVEIAACFAWGVALYTGTIQGHENKHHPRGPPSSMIFLQMLNKANKDI